MVEYFVGFSRVQLGVCVSQVVKQDFPGKWPGVAEKILMYLKSDLHDTWMGALVCLHQLVKNFELVLVIFFSVLNLVLCIKVVLLYHILRNNHIKYNFYAIWQAVN